MYTECPECTSVFRVTAKILQQGRGKVRCGGCGTAFSALDYLSEDLPVPAADNATLTGAFGDAPVAAGTGPDFRDPLIARLEELTGSDDVLIEDTGTEWRVLDELVADIEAEAGAETAAATPDEPPDRAAAADGRAPDGAEDVVVASDIGDRDNETDDRDNDRDNDRDTHNAGDPAMLPNPEPFATDGNAPDGAEDVAATNETDDHDDDRDTHDAGDATMAAEPEPFAAGSPQASLELDAPPATDEAAWQFDDHTPHPDAIDDDETGDAGLLRRSDDHADYPDMEAFNEHQVDFILSEPGDWTDLLDEVRNVETAERDVPLEVEEELAAIHHELSAKESPPDASPGDATEANDKVWPEPDADVESEAAGDIAPDTDIDYAPESSVDNDALSDIDAGPETEIGEPIDTNADPASADENNPDASAEIDDGIDIDARATDDEIVANEDTDADPDHAIDASDDAGVDDAKDAADGAAIDADVEGGPPVLDTVVAADGTESRLSVLAGEDLDEMGDAEESQEDAAEQDADGPAVLLEEPVADAASRADEDSPIDKAFEDGSFAVETIILEGESIRNAIEEKLLAEGTHDREPAAGSAASSADDDAGPPLDADGALFGTDADLDGIRGGRRRSDPSGYGVIAATVLFALLLGGQLVHTYRESLSTYGFFNRTIGPVYRMLGQPVTPVWDIQGWQFESTNGNVAADGALLTIVSRISNQSESALPYPLVHVSLTDRWEEIIGSRVLAPVEYLAGDIDPDRAVLTGEDFTAVITVDDPATAATGFKLNVCYRDAPGRVRCATEDFKD